VCVCGWVRESEHGNVNGGMNGLESTWYEWIGTLSYEEEDTCIYMVWMDSYLIGTYITR
jgi:hypothetical protein